MAVDPNNENIWYVGAPAGGIWKSTNAGQSWTNLFDDFLQIGVSGIAIDPNDSNILYITTGDDDAADSYSIGVYKSTDGGLSWNPTGLTTSGVNTLMNEIVIDPTNSSILWVGTSSGLYRSTDAGDTWELMQSGYISDFKLKPRDPNTIYAVGNRHIGGGAGIHRGELSIEELALGVEEIENRGDSQHIGSIDELVVPARRRQRISSRIPSRVPRNV